MSEEERLKQLEEDFLTLSNSLIDVSDNNEEIIKELDDLKTNFKAFYLAVLEASPKDLAETIFKTYQKIKFKK